MYTPLTGNIWASKAIWYDYINFRYRADSFYLAGQSNPITTLYNFTSVWINTTLTMITYADGRSDQPASCVVLDMGITMMRPNWMTDQGGCKGDLWQNHKSAGYDPNYHRTVWTRINAIPGDEGNFDWFSDFTTGLGYMMQAPGPNPAAYVINEEQDLLAASFAPDSTVFTPYVPQGVVCKQAGRATSHAHAQALVRAAGGEPALAMLAALPEVALSFRLAALAGRG